MMSAFMFPNTWQQTKFIRVRRGKTDTEGRQRNFVPREARGRP